MDQTIEEAINKDTQKAGGTKGFSSRANAGRNIILLLKIVLIVKKRT